MVRSFLGRAPQIASSVYIDPQAVVIGSVSIDEDSSIWPCAVLRGDYPIPQARLAVDLGAPFSIRIGARTSIQDGCVLHIQGERFSISVGDDVTVGHGVILHGCTVESNCLIGMGAILLNGSKISTGSIVAAGTLIPEGMEIPPGSLVMGVPGKVRRSVTEAERAQIASSAEHYVGFKNAFLAENYR
jgi:gamma-carbonic anhydrase